MKMMIAVTFVKDFGFKVDETTTRNFSAGWSGEVPEDVADAAEEAGVLADDDDIMPMPDPSIEVVVVETFELGGFTLSKKGGGYFDIAGPEGFDDESVRGEEKAKERLIELLTADAQQAAASESEGQSSPEDNNETDSGSSAPTS